MLGEAACLSSEISSEEAELLVIRYDVKRALPSPWDPEQGRVHSLNES